MYIPTMGVRHFVSFLLLPLIFPMIGSRLVGSGISVVSFDNSEEGDSVHNVPILSAEETEPEESGNNITVVASPCALVTMSLLDGRDGKLMAYDDKTLISVSHETFDVSQGIVAGVIYQVVLEIPSSHEFSLEFWLNGLSEEKVKQKRRHQRERRDTLLELYPQDFDSLSPDSPAFSSSSSSSNDKATSNDPFVFCSKSSLAGVNREPSAKQLKFHWYINGNSLISQASVSGLPSNVIFRLRFRSVVEATTSVFEQNLSVIIRSDCYLQLKVEDKTKLTLDSLWNPKTDNRGLNCTVFIVPKKNFGLEVKLSSLSVYGMRDICKGRFLQFTRPKRISSFPYHSSGSTSGRAGGSSTVLTSSPNSGKNVEAGSASSGTTDLKYNHNNNNNFVENIHEYPPYDPLYNLEDSQRQQQSYSPLERKFCGKLEDYMESERTLTFPSSESTLLSSSSHSSFTSQDHFDNEIPIRSGIPSNLPNNPRVWGVYLTVKLPVAVKVREAFAFDLTALSPCQRVTLNGLDGELKYSKHYENEQCSVVIHVPYGNTILTQIGVSSSGSDDRLSESVRATENRIRSDIISSISSVDVLSSGSRESRSESPEVVSSGNLPIDPDVSSNSDDGALSLSKENVANWAQNYSSSNSNNITNYVTEGSSNSKNNDRETPESTVHQQADMYYNAETFDNSIPLPSSSIRYECPVSLKLNELETNGINGILLPLDPSREDETGRKRSFDDGPDSDDSIERKQQLLQNQKYLLIQAVDMVSGSEFNWCFDASKQNAAHKRAWKSSGNRVSINFRLSHFDSFILTYQSVKIPELTGDCDRGWVKVDGACVTVVEKLMKWTDAEESCQLRGGHLVTIKNQYNENKLEKLVAESPFFLPSRAYWIGANDRESEGNFQWTSGLAFQYKNWFPGWTHQDKHDRSEILSAQPNDDGWSGQDCVEIRQITIPQSPTSSSNDKAFSPFSIKSEIWGLNNRVNERGHSPQFPGQGSQTKDNGFYWNDRNCEVKNFHICEKGTHQNVDVSCNRTLKLSPPHVPSMVVTSPAYPSAYPDNIVCVTTIETVPGYKLILSFDEFFLEESPGCQYDSLEILEIQADAKAESTSTPSARPSRTNQQPKTSRSTTTRINNGNVNKGGKKICGDWTKKLKLLRYTTASKSTQVILKFESDFSHHFPGFKVKVTAEKDMEEQCMEQQMQRYGNHCYLFVSFPAVTWTTAHQICETLKGNLASILSAAEWNFLSRTMLSAPDYDKKSIYWLGGSIDQNNQLGWVDHMPFNFSGFHAADLQTRYDFRCLSIYWHDSGGGKGDLAWRLTECSQTAGYVCKKRTQESRQILNRTFSGTGGKLASANYPSNYVNNMDHRNHLIAPRGTKIVIRFSHLDVEPQENCLYDYVEIVDRTTRNRTRLCGTYLRAELNRLDYVSSSNEVDVIFHTDFSNTFTGYELLWRAVDVTSCMSGKTIMAGFIGSPFPLEDQTIHTPNFPYFNLPHLDCVYHIVAPAGQRLWISFQVFELGQSLPTSRSNNAEDGEGNESFGERISWTGIDCQQQDHVSIDLTGGQHFPNPSSGTSDGKLLSDLASDNEILLCGNLSSIPYRTSFVSSSERIAIRVRSPEGRSGRGFLGRFKAVPHVVRETLIVNTEPNSTMSLTSLNFPLEPPPMANLTLSFNAPPQYVIILKILGSTKCPPTVKSYLEIRDPYVGKNGVTRIICHLRESTFPSYIIDDGGDNNVNRNGNSGRSDRSNMHVMKNDDMFGFGDNDNDAEERVEGDNGISLGKTVQFRSRFNRLSVKQVYLAGYHGAKWNAQIITTLDENFRAEVIADGDRLLLLNACSPNPCSNGGTCVTEKGRHICRCPAPFTGPFCALSLCDLNPCLFGECVMEGKTFKCECVLGYGGDRCERRYKPCDDRPCSGHGDCIEVNKTSYKCLCHAWWEGLQCESRMLHIPYKPLSQRMLEEPFWLGLITVFVVMGVIGLIWCLKRHFPEKLEKFLSEDLERNRGISWAPSSVRTGGALGPGPLGIRDAIPGTSQQAASPPTTRSFLGRLGIRKPSLLSLSSATSNVSATVASPHTYENRTFSLDDLLRPSRGMLRTPSPHRRRNYSVQVRRDPAEKQQILQQLVSPGPSSSFDGESKPTTPKPTLAEIIQMSEKRLRLASQSSMQEPQPSTSAAAVAANAACSNNTSIDSVTSQRQGGDSAETSFTTIVPQSTAASIKAEKKVTFAHMLDKLAAGEMTSSSSCSDVSCGEESKIIVTVPPKSATKKDRKGRFRRSKSYRSRTSEEDGAEISSSDTTPDPIFPPRFPLRICISPTNTSGPSISTTNASSTLTLSTTSGGAPPAVPTSLSAKPASSSGKMTKIASADSLLSLFRRFSGSSSAPPSPQYSENEESSAGATPLSTPSSPRNSALSLRPPAFLITTPEPSTSCSSSNNNNNNTIELPVIDPFTLGPAPGSAWNRSSGAQTITLEVPMRDYCLSPIHEVPTPLPTPSHSPAHTPMMRRPSHDDGIPMIRVQSSEEDEHFGYRREYTPESSNSASPRKIEIPLISISVEDGDNINDDDEDDDDDDDGSDDGGEQIDSRGVNKRQITSFEEKRRMNFPGEPEVIPDVLINVPPDASLESKPDHNDRENMSGYCMDSGGPGPPTSLFGSQVRSKPRPPPLIFANEILTSCSSKTSKEDSSGSTSSGSGSTSSNTNSSSCNSSCTSTTSSTSSTSSSSSGGCGSGGGGEAAGNGNNNSKGMLNDIPLLNVEFATPVSEVLPKFVTSQEDIGECMSDKTPTVEVVSCMAIPQIWDCPLVPPMITINQSSEAESDSDTTVAKSIRRPNLNFLSPFAGDTNRVPSESNLSTSGYSSMASPCASRCPSVSPLCPSEMDDYHNCHHSHGNANHPFIRRSSLTPGTPKRTSPTQRRSSLNSGLASLTSSGFLDKRSQSEEKYEEDKIKLAEVEIETDSAVEIETDMEYQPNSSETATTNTILSPPECSDNSNSILVPASTPPTPIVPIFPEDLKCINNLLQVPKKGFPKSRSLDINSTMMNDMSYMGRAGVITSTTSPGITNTEAHIRNQQLKALGPSLDSKLNSMEQFFNGQKGVGITISLPPPATTSNKSLVHSTGNLIEIPEESKERRLSPVSSRSESPLSELSAVSGFAAFPGYPITDSDGMYDCPSSEVPSNNNIPRLTCLNKLSPQQQLRRSGRRKDRRLARNKTLPSTSVVTSVADLLPPPLIPSPVVYQTAVTSPTLSDTSKPGNTGGEGVVANNSPIIFGPDGNEERSVGANLSQLVFPHIDLPPSLARESLVPVGAISIKRASPKRRVRAQPNLDISSSSSESLSSRSRSRTSVSSFQQSSCSPHKRSLEEGEPTYALSDSAIGKVNSISDVVSNKEALTGEDDCVPGTSKKV
ncbi:unnamed protein product [Orchesella dallaii]|uniref:Cubilin n=1 Tax=Orchesella dallaii TaxID=48710 RepID=A0ABP1QH06_9HEXA